MRIELLKSTIVDMKPVSPGDVIEVTERVGWMLIRMNKAKESPVSQTVVITSEAKEAPVPKKTSPKKKPKAKGNSQSGV